jgi:release factor glutamine methyltransferase
VTSDCLIPQADTEIVTEKLIAKLKKGDRFADICTGSGCIALTALTKTAETTAVGYELSEGALSVARENAKRLGQETRFEAVHADVFAEDFLAGEMFDAIVSNPPYIETDVIGTLSYEVQAEPHMALDGGHDGLRFYRRLLDICPSHIRKGGMLFLEIGYDQREALTALCMARGLSCEFYCDFGGNTRVCVVSL